MILVKPSFEIIDPIDGEAMLRKLEVCGRVCYKSEDKITPESYRKFVSTIIKNHHLSVIEHNSFTVRFTVDRGVSHEIVRHRLASFSQESTRYVNYAKGQCTFVLPPWVGLAPGEYNGEQKVFSIHSDIAKVEADHLWYQEMLNVEAKYLKLTQLGWAPQQTRSILPNSTKTEICVTANLREWAHILTERTSKAAHPQFREVSIPLLKELQSKIPIIFDDIVPE